MPSGTECLSLVDSLLVHSIQVLSIVLAAVIGTRAINGRDASRAANKKDGG